MTTRPRLLSVRRARILALLVANGLTQAALAVALSLLVKAVFDQHLSSNGVSSAANLPLQGAGLMTCVLLLAFVRGRAFADAERLAQDYLSELRQIFFDKLVALSPQAMQKRSRGGLMLRFLGDLGALRLWISLGLARVLVAVAACALAIAALAWLSWPLALALAAAVAAGTSLVVLLSSRFQLAIREARRVMAKTAANISEKIASMPVIQAYGQGARERVRFGKHNAAMRDSQVARGKMRGLVRGVADGAAHGAIAIVLMTGVVLAANGEISAGTVAAAMSIVTLLVAPIRDMGRAYEYWQGAQVSCEKIDNFLGLPSLLVDTPSSVDLQTAHGAIELRGATLTGCFKGIHASVRARARVAIVGPNGAGKSSLLRAIARMTELDSGQILVDGTDIRDVTLASLRKAMSLAAPELGLLKGSIDYNLRYREREAPPEEIARVRAQCGIDEMLAELPQQERTVVKEAGANLSSGQRARLGLGRALVGRPAVLLLDEVDANLDPRSITFLDAVVADYPGTVIAVTHRLESMLSSDVIWYLEAGVLLEAGPPSQLLAGAGAAARFIGSLRPPASKTMRIVRA